MWAVNHQQLLQQFKQQLGIFNQSQSIDYDSDEEELESNKKRKRRDSTENVDRWVAKLEIESLTMKTNFTKLLGEFRAEMKKLSDKKHSETSNKGLEAVIKKLDKCMKSVESTNHLNQQLLQKVESIDKKLSHIEDRMEHKDTFLYKEKETLHSPTQNRILIPPNEIPRFRRSK